MTKPAEKTWEHPVPVTLCLRKQEYQVKPGMDLRSVLRKIGVDSEAVLAIRNGEMITDDEILSPGDQVKLVHVISGG
jgi:sulfur carrier protein ThiS